MSLDPRQMRPADLPINLTPDVIEGILRHGRHETIVALVARTDLPSSMIHEFSRHRGHDIRLAVARNSGASTETLLQLAQDAEAKIRTATVAGLAARLSETAASRPKGADREIIDSLEHLAEDEMAVVRRTLSQVMLAHANPPPTVLNKLARDLDRAVAEPILMEAPGLDERILREAIEHYPPPWVLKAIAHRKQLGAKITDGIIEHRDAPSAGVILDNEGAVISRHGFGTMVEMAETHPELQEPLALHPALPRSEMVRLAYFSGERILALLKQARRIDPLMARQLAKVTAKRLAETRRIATYQDAVEYAARLERSGTINDEWLTGRLDGEDPTLVIGVLAFRARAHPLIVKRILESESAKAITALTWRAGFAMRTAREIMMQIAQLPHDKVLNARGGTDYPLSQRDMVWYLEFFGLEDGNAPTAALGQA